MQTDAPEPGARVLWSLRRRKTDVRCVLWMEGERVEVHVLQERDLILKERFADEWSAVTWAKEYETRLKQHGWNDSPQENSPSSAA